MAEKLLTTLFLLASIFYLSCARHFTFGTLQSPQSGFLPTIVAYFAIIVSCILLGKQFYNKRSENAPPVAWKKFISTLIGLIFYISVFKSLGYFAATFIFLFYLFKITSKQSNWWIPLLIALISALGFNLIFKYYLAVALP